MSVPSLAAEEQERAILEQTLERMAAQSSESEALLTSLAAAVFPQGIDGARVTWSERSSANGADASAQSAEARLLAAEERFRTLVEQIPAVTFVAVLGEGKNEIYISPHIESLLGFSQKEWMESPFLWYWQLHPDDRELWNEEFARGCRTGGPFKAECRFFARDGRVVWVHGEARLVKDEIGRPSLLQGVAFDITESKRAQEVLLTEATRKARIEREMAIARRVQTSILPRDLRVEQLQIAAAMKTADEVGGDYYDVMPFSGGAWLSIGDVSGHGLDSGLVMLMVQSAMATLCASGESPSPRAVLTAVNGVLFDNIRKRLGFDDHVTLTLFRYTRDGRVVFAGAHEELLVFRQRGGVEVIRTPGTWLGAMRDIGPVTSETTLQLERGDLMVLYTDGVVEARNARGEELDTQRLIDAVASVRDKPASAIRDHVLAVVHQWMAEQLDDLSVMVMRYGAEPEPGAAEVDAASDRVREGSPALRLVPTPGQKLSSLEARPSGTGRLGSSGTFDRSEITLRLSGAAETPDRPVLRSLLDALHTEALTRKVTRVNLDIRHLDFMNSSCFKDFVGWVSRVQGWPAEGRYAIHFLSASTVRWQRASLAALAAFAPNLVSITE